MSLILLNEDLSNFQKLTTSHNGFTGEAIETLIYIRNDNELAWYKNIKMYIEMESLEEGSLFSSDGWSYKIKYGSEQPSEKEWGAIYPNNFVLIEDIGNNLIANTESLFPVWIRIFCPGHEEPKIKNDMKLILEYEERLVGE